jgi:serine/threonine-protein kinase HipA
VSFEPVRRLAVLYEPEEGRRIAVGRLARVDRELLFEYDPTFLTRGLELSPLKLPLRPGVVTGRADRFDGLMGLFDDSLPDGWGRLLLDRRAARAGISPAALGPLDRLALIGSGAMGALVYEPEAATEPPSIIRLSEIATEVDEVLREVGAPDLDRLIALGGSPHGARPKALVQLGDDGTLVFGDRRSRHGCTAWLVKFHARGDDRHAGVLEHAYARMAAAAGIEIPETRMLGRSARHPGYFAIRRFDRDGRRKVHALTLAGVLEAPHWYPSVTYRDLLLTTRALTRDEAAVREMFRRACFNVLAHNRDDHTRNFAFAMSERGEWSVAPAYDLTCSDGPGGEHAMLVGDGANPTAADLRALADEVGLRRATGILDEVRAAVAKFARYADDAGVPRALRDRVAGALGVTGGKRRTTSRRK